MSTKEEETKSSFTFNRVMGKIPKKLQEDEYILETVAAYLKVGGEKLANQSVEVFKAIDKLEIVRRKRKLRNKAMLRTAGALKIKQEIEASKNGRYNDFGGLKTDLLQVSQIVRSIT